MGLKIKRGGDIVSSVISKFPHEIHLRTLKGRKIQLLWAKYKTRQTIKSR